MKTTIDIDERKLTDVMKLAGVRSRKAAVDYALSCTERMERLRKVFEKPLPDEEYRDALDPEYDLMAAREKDKPHAGARLLSVDSHFRYVPGLQVSRDLPDLFGADIEPSPPRG